jgi:UDP-glucuronate 4-epimerase
MLVHWHRYWVKKAMNSDITLPDMKGRTVLITGVAGFVGCHVARTLLNLGASVTGIDNINSYYSPELKLARIKTLTGKAPTGKTLTGKSGFTFHKMDLSEHDALKALVQALQPSAIIHLAAQAGVRYSISNPHAYISANVDGFLSVLEACRATPVPHLIYASSSSVYGANTKVPFQEDDPVLEPVSLYAATKRSNELMAQTYAHLYGVTASGLRFFTVYGPWGRPDMAYYKFTKAILEGEPIDVYNHGEMQRDFTYIDDVVEGIVRLIDMPPSRAATITGTPVRAPHMLYNIGNHTPVSLGDFITTIEHLAGRKAIRNLLPMQQGDVPATFADVSRLAKVTGFAPRTALATGLAEFMRWYCDFHDA